MAIMETSQEFKCPECGRVETNPTNFSRHCARKHKLDTRKLCIDFFYGGVEPTCACGCGRRVKFHSFLRKFSEFCPGHQSRVKNNWGHNEKAQKKSQDKRREMHKRGEIRIWNTGLTKETDERLAAYGQRGSKTIRREEKESQKRSKQMVRQWEEGSLKPLIGPDHPQWKGGVSQVHHLMRADHTLYKSWRLPKLQAAGFKCTQCESTQDLCVHHDKEKMSDIMHRIMEEFSFDASTATHEEKRAVVNAITEYHVKNNVSGVVLCKACHQKEHPNLNL